ncbi:5'-nucleotidase C-terminal domain-containing protein [Paenibacillus flagellatus]|uniref:Multifunctional 2',3'-cyclic-nucleotide 2'-phosphodiesterase/5'-nucleotidase/3'-nucleotidase n=1 Tax=Paenibacillus flagellatus TaxID=2211139 RepID=A0A2V5JUG7_9BACL|nr:5'-nucleotidase C-terminal domain-containing protein [Paenibacillus flagellatus]PYI50305.1 multifunctional 2',3'-cyclic-nucleotide 2'-phosphodiesterase/5'-nucleotidase/3'-nucleotidase [Paenibacillus flagellatus]
MIKPAKWSLWLFALLLALSAVQTATAAPAAAEAAGSRTVTLFHTNDVHARVESTKDVNIGYAEMVALVRSYKKEHPNTLLIDAGDTFHGQTIANLVRGESIVDIMNAAGYDAMAPGNHDFNYGYARLVELSKRAQFPVVSANVKQADGERLLAPYVIKEAGGLKIGFFGLTTPETAYKTHPKNVEGITFADPAAEAKAIVAELKGKVDAIVAIAHLGVDLSSADTSIKVARAVPEIDVILDGHSHTAMEAGRLEGGVLIAQTGEYLKQIGRVDLTFENGKLTSKKASLITKQQVVEQNVQPDPKVLDIVGQVKQAQEAVLQEVVGSAGVKLVGEREVVRKGESNLGNLIADAMLSETGADAAITNGGGIRASIEAGPITKGDVITVLPFGNYIQTKKVKGADIKAALELGVSAYPESLGGFPQVGGLSFEFDPSLPKNARITSIAVKGEPLDPERTYVLATNDFMAAGGDNYTMFKDYPVANDFSSLEESLIAYIRQAGELKPATEGRIRVKAAAAAPQPAPAAQRPAPAAQAPAASAESGPAAGSVYTVRPGDSLWAIAKKYGTTWQTLHKLNPVPNPNLIYPGQVIVLP